MRYFFITLILLLRFSLLLWVDQAAWLRHMPGEFHKRALAVALDQTHANLAAWGSYPLFLGQFYKFMAFLGLGDFRYEGLFILQQVMAVLTAFCFYRSALLLQVREKVAFWGATLLILWNPGMIYLSTLVISEPFFILILSIFIYLALQFHRSPRWHVILMLSLLAGVLISLRNIFIPVVFGLFTVYLFLFVFQKHYRKAGRLLGGVLGALLVCGTISAFNSRYDKLGKGDLNSNKGANLAQTWCEASFIRYENPEGNFWFSPPLFWNMPKTWGLVFAESFSDNAFYKNQALSCLRANPLSVFVRLRSLVHAFDGPLYPDPSYIGESFLFRAWQFLLLSLLVYTILQGRQVFRGELLTPLVIVAGSLASIYVGNVGEARFAYSFLPALGLIALSVQRFPWKLQELGKVSLAVLIALGLWQLPSLNHLVEHQKWMAFQRDAQEGQNANLKKALRGLSVPSRDYCESILPELNRCQNSLCGSQEKSSFKNAVLVLQTRPLSEQELFCRNFKMLRALRNGVEFSSAEVQNPPPLPEGGKALDDPLEAVAGQLLHYHLLDKLNASTTRPESKEQLVFKLFHYRYRDDVDHLRKNQVSRYLNVDQPQDEAVWIYARTFEALLDESVTGF